MCVGIARGILDFPWVLVWDGYGGFGGFLNRGDIQCKRFKHGVNVIVDD